MKQRLFIGLFLAVTCQAQAQTIELADPTIFLDNGTYYLSGTNAPDGFLQYKSTDLVKWEKSGKAQEGYSLKKGDVFGTKGFWAPQYFKQNGIYYMAYTANELIAIAKSSSPEGPYTMESKVELPHDDGQIDPFVFVDDDGTKYLYHVRFDGANTLYVAELTDDFSSIKPGSITKCLGAELPWEKAEHYSTYKVTEGPTVMKDGEYYYLIYSANDFRDIDYSVGYAYSKSPRGPWIKPGWPFLNRYVTGWNGTGHGDLFKGKDGQFYYVFHTHHNNEKVEKRRTAIVSITLTDNPMNKFIPQMDQMRFLGE